MYSPKPIIPTPKKPVFATRTKIPTPEKPTPAPRPKKQILYVMSWTYTNEKCWM